MKKKKKRNELRRKEDKILPQEILPPTFRRGYFKRLDILCIFALLLLVLIYDIRITLMRGIVITDDIFASDITNYLYPVRVLLGEFIKDGKLPLWTPLVYNGFPLFANAEVGVWYPINWILFGLLKPGIALNLLIILKFFLSGFFLYLYLRKIGNFPLSSLFGSIAFAWCGFFIVHVKHINMTDSAMWLPLILLSLEMFFDKNRALWIFITGGLFGIQILAGHPQICYYTGLFIIFYSGWKIIKKRKYLRYGAPLVLSLVFGAGIGMVQILPTLELSSISERGGGVSYEFAAGYPYYIPDLLTFLYPYVNGTPSAGTYIVNGIFWEDYGYIGILPLVFAILGVILFWRRENPLVKFWTITLILSGVLMLGDSTPLFKIVYTLLPGMKYFRFPTRFILFVCLSLCVLASIGFQKILDFRLRGNDIKRRFSLIHVIVLLLTVFDLFYFQKRQNPVVDRRIWESIPKTARIISMDKNLFRIFTIGGTDSHKLAFVKASGWEGDLTPYIEQREFLQPSMNIQYGLASADGYLNLIPRHVIAVWGNEKQPGIIHKTGRISPDGKNLEISKGTIEILKAFNVKYILSLWELKHPSLSFIGRIKDVYLYENKDVMPRAYLVSNVIFIDEKKAEDPELVSGLVKGEENLEKSVILSLESNTEKVNADTTNPGSVEIISYSPESIRLKVNCLIEKAWLVISDTDYPGWEAFVNERKVKIHRANLCVRAIEIYRGKHEVRFEFKPKSLFYGGLISIFSFIVCGAGIVWLKKTVIE